MTDYNKGSRKTYVEKVTIDHFRPEDPLYPAWLNEGHEKRDIWLVWLETRTGMKPSTSSALVFNSEAEAAAASAAYPVGSELEGMDSAFFGRTESHQRYIEALMDSSELGSFPAGVDEDLFLPHQVLADAGITSGQHTSQRILDYLGDQRVGELKERHGDNWKAAAEFEYCWCVLPHSSPAYIAAACHYHYFVTGSTFSAGYLLRDLEVIVMGVEAEASKAVSMRRKAGVEGSKKSAQARERRRVNLMENIEIVAARNPDVVKFGLKILAPLALKLCVESEPGLWSQGRGQIDEYLGEIRRGEAGPEMLALFRAIFS